MAEPYYTTADDLRSALEVSEEILPDQEAVDLIEVAEDLIDDRLGNRPVDESTGRKVVPADEDAWRIAKLAKATLEVAKVLYKNPDVQNQQRMRSVTGDVSLAGPYGPAYGERAEVLLSQSGLAVKFARMGCHGSRSDQIARKFFQEPS